MAHQLVHYDPDQITVDSGGTITVASGATLTVAGTFAYTHAGAMEFDNAVNVVGAFSVNTSSFTVAAATGNTVIAGSLTIGAGAGTITDDVATLTLTETNLALVGATTVTGATGVTGAFGVTGLSTLNSGAATPSLKLNSAGDKSGAEYAAVGTHVGDGGTFAFVADQMYARVYIGATVYNIPLWADA